jgi:hypothetical protein
MANPLTPDQLVNVLRAEGLRVVTVDEWRTHNRNHKGAWGPINGVMIHHTGGGPDGAVAYCYDGSAVLPGPLCHGVITKDGTVYIISAGRANHAGGGDPNVLQAVIDERYNDSPPQTHKHDGSAGAADGNARFYGFECVNMGDGKDPWPGVQVDAIVRAGAAIARAYGWSAKSVIAHREWSDWKPDPAGPGMPSMPVVRAKIAERLAHPPGWNPSDEQGPEDMAEPNLSVLVRDGVTNLTPNAHLPIYWSGEWIDDGNEHGDGGKSVLNGGKYSASLGLTITGLGDGEVLTVYAAGTNPTTGVVTPMRAHQIFGRGTPAQEQKQVVHFTGRVSDFLSFQVHTTGTDVACTEMQLCMLSWPDA